MAKAAVFARQSGLSIDRIPLPAAKGGGCVRKPMETSAPITTLRQ